MDTNELRQIQKIVENYAIPWREKLIHLLVWYEKEYWHISTIQTPAYYRARYALTIPIKSIKEALSKLVKENGGQK